MQRNRVMRSPVPSPRHRVFVYPTEFLHGSQNISETNIHNDKYNIDEVLNRDS